MTKNELINDVNFRAKCFSYELGLNCEDFYIYRDIIVLRTTKENIFVLLDEQYNIIDIIDKKDDISKYASFEKRIINSNDLYKTTYIKLPFPFQYLSLKQLVELSNRISILETNHGHSFDMIVNGEMVDDEDNSIYISLLSYIKFLGQQIEQYYKNLYQMRMMELPYPDVHKYVASLMNNIYNYIYINSENGRRLYPIDIIDYLGQSREKIDKYDLELSEIIDLLSERKEEFDLPNISLNLLKILEVSDEEVKARYELFNKTFGIKIINLQSWLSEGKSKIPMLTKSKK